MAEYIRKNRIPQKGNGVGNVQTENKQGHRVSRQHGKKVKRRSRRKGLRLFTLVIFLGVILATVLAILLYTPLFNINKIEVTGNKYVNTADIMAEAKIPLGRNVFRFSEGGLIDRTLLTWAPIEKRLVNKFVAIDTVNISYKIGGKIAISINERVPFAWIKVKNQFLLLDEKAMILKKQNQEQKGLFLTGIKADGATVGKKVVVNERDWAALLRVIDLCKNHKGMPFALVDDIKSFDLSKTDKLSFRLKSGIQVILGDVSFLSNPDLIYRFQYIKSAVNELKDKNSGVIDSSNGHVLYRP